MSHSIAFLDVFISVIDNQNLTLQTYHKLTYTRLLLNCISFTLFSYKYSLIKCLIGRSFKICNNWNSFHKDIEKIKSNLIKNAYPPFLIDKVIKKYIDHRFSSNHNQLKIAIAFLDVFISVIDNQNLTLQTYHKLTYTRLLLNCISFTLFSYKYSLIKCLIGRSFKICNNWNSFHKDIEKIKSNLIKNAYPPFLIDKVIKKYIDHRFSSNHNQLMTFVTLNYHILATFCPILKIHFVKKSFKIKLVFNSFKIKSYFSNKDPIPDDLNSFLVRTVNCASCSSTFIGETCRHFKTRTKEHIK